MSLLQLIYLSQETAPLTSRELTELVAHSSRANEPRRITGALYYGGGLFIQAIEGYQSDVLRLYTKILDDPRHEDVELIAIRPIKERSFAAWMSAG